MSFSIDHQTYIKGRINTHNLKHSLIYKGLKTFKLIAISEEEPENDQLDVYTAQRDIPFLEYQHPSPLKEGPKLYITQNQTAQQRVSD